MVRAETSSGFRFVRSSRKKYWAELEPNSERHNLGHFQSPEEAALHVARWLRDHPAMDESGQVQPHPKTATGALAAATIGGLTLRQSIGFLKRPEGS